MTKHEFVIRQQEAGLWEPCQALFTKAQTLDKYFRVYELVNILEPGREHGYKKRLCGFEQCDRYNIDAILEQLNLQEIDQNLIGKALLSMEDKIILPHKQLINNALQKILTTGTFF